MSVLHVVTAGSVLQVRAGQLCCEFPDGTRKHVPCDQLTGIVVYGRCGFDSEVCRMAALLGVPLVMAGRTGRMMGMVLPPALGNGRVRVAQALVHADPVRSMGLARLFVRGKIQNQLVMLRRRGLSYIPLQQCLSDLDAAQSVSELMGIEGIAAREYLSGIWSTLSPELVPLSRSRRPPLDAVNALMGLLYAFLASEVAVALWSCGLDASIGYLHGLRSGKPSLALDLMEEFRPVLADVVMLGLFGRGTLSLDDFQSMELGPGVHLSPESFPAVIRAWEERLASTAIHPLIGGKGTYRQIIVSQGHRLVRHVLGDEVYQPYVVR